MTSLVELWNELSRLENLVQERAEEPGGCITDDTVRWEVAERLSRLRLLARMLGLGGLASTMDKLYAVVRTGELCLDDVMLLYKVLARDLIERDGHTDGSVGAREGGGTPEDPYECAKRMHELALILKNFLGTKHEVYVAVKGLQGGSELPVYLCTERRTSLSLAVLDCVRMWIDTEDEQHG